MAEQTFRSPGFFEQEIDLSTRAASQLGTPAGVIGTSNFGPAFVPVTIGSFTDFETRFGGLDPDRFGPYAVNEFLKRRDAVSLRHTYIVFQIQNNISEFIIGKNVGTSGKMIYENYTKNLKTIDLLEKLTNVHSEKSRQNRLVVIK